MNICMCCGTKMKRTLTVEREYVDGKNIVILNAPVDMCFECNEEYYTAEVYEKIESIKDQMMTKLEESTETTMVVEFDKF